MSENNDFPVDSMKAANYEERLKEAVAVWMEMSTDTAEGFDRLLSDWRPEDVRV